MRPQIGFRLGYDEDLLLAADAAQEGLAEEVARDLVRRPVKESRLKNCARARCGRRSVLVSWDDFGPRILKKRMPPSSARLMALAMMITASARMKPYTSHKRKAACEQQ